MNHDTGLARPWIIPNFKRLFLSFGMCVLQRLVLGFSINYTLLMVLQSKMLSGTFSSCLDFHQTVNVAQFQALLSGWSQSKFYDDGHTEFDVTVIWLLAHLRGWGELLFISDFFLYIKLKSIMLSNAKVRFIWPSKWKIGKILFLLSRYSTTIDIAMDTTCALHGYCTIAFRTLTPTIVWFTSGGSAEVTYLKCFRIWCLL